jgi:hypothetical protein
MEEDGEPSDQICSPTKKIRIKKNKSKPTIIKTYYLENLLSEYLKDNPETQFLKHLVKYKEETVFDEHGSYPKYIPERFSEDLDFLKKEDYDIPQITNTYIPFEIIDKMIPMDMELNYHDATVGLPGNDFEVYATDSANWYQDRENLEVGDIVLDEGDSFSRSGVYPYLVVNYKGQKCLIGFELSSGDYERGFCDGDSINPDGEAIHPFTGELVKVI